MTEIVEAARSSYFKEVQITREIQALCAHISTLKEEIAKVPVAHTAQDSSSDTKTFDRAALPRRFANPGDFKLMQISGTTTSGNSIYVTQLLVTHTVQLNLLSLRCQKSSKANRADFQRGSTEILRTVAML